MRPLLLIIFTLTIAFASGQNFSYPVINTYGRTLPDFIPSNWVLLDSVSGDLNNDQVKDWAFVIQYRDSVSLIKNDKDYSDTVITQPRILVIAFYDKATAQYELTEQSNTFILNHDSPTMDEPFQDITISKGILQIDFLIFMSAGGWGMSNNIYKFRYENKSFVLIGADYNATNRASGEMEDRSYNFLTKKVSISTGNISAEKLKTVWRKFKMDALKTFSTFTQPFTWEVEKDYYL